MKQTTVKEATKYDVWEKELTDNYEKTVANRRLRENKKVVASFSRGLTESLISGQIEEEFDKVLKDSIESIAKAGNDE